MQRDFLYTHGYIATTFGAWEAPPYFTRLPQFGVGRHQLHITLENEVFIIYPAVSHVQPSTYICDEPAWLLDYKVRDYGSVVPQSIWIPPTTHVVGLHYVTVPLSVPVFFVHGDRRTLGLRVVQAAAGNCAELLNAHAPAPDWNTHTTEHPNSLRFIRLKVSICQVAHRGAIVRIVSASSGLATTNRVARL